MRLTAAALLAICFFAIAQNARPQTAQQNPCALPEQQQMQFWVGEWEAAWPGTKPGEVQHGTNSVHRVLDNCIIEENFSGGDAIPLRGKSFSLFDVRSGGWKQTWVDNQGGYLDFTGRFVDGQMTLTREFIRADGVRVRQRMVYKNIKPDGFDWSWESSTDNGKTWNIVWPIHYTRLK